MRGPLASVIVPVYNGERFLAAALESIFAQDYEPFEVIVVDDGSEDGTAPIARSFTGVVYLYQPNQGPSAARNAGIAAAGGEFLAFLDADDLMMPNKLGVQVGYLLDHPQIGCVLSNHETFLEPGVEPPAWLKLDRPHEEIREVPLQLAGSREVWRYLRMGGMSAVIRREALDRVGGFDPSFRHAGDLDWLFRVWEAGVGISMLPEKLMRRRIHHSNITHRRPEAQDGWIRFLKAMVDRRRAAAFMGDEART